MSEATATHEGSPSGLLAFLRRPLHWLLAAAPLAAVLDSAGAPAALVFLAAGLALLPLATLIVHSTEEIAARTGPAVGGLLNATFGNLPELIISFVALRAGLLDMVRASLIGALLANLLLALGVGFILGGRRHHVQEFNPAAARTYGSIMLLAAMSMVGPASFHRFFSGQAPAHAMALDTGVCFVLLALYALYLVFMLRTHPDFFSVLKGGEENHEPQWSTGRAGATLVAASVGAAWMSEILVGAAEETGHSLGMSATFIGIVVLASRFVAPQRLTLSFNRAEIGSLFLGVLIGVIVVGDGRANWFKGAQLVGFYRILAALFYLLPEVAA